MPTLALRDSKELLNRLTRQDNVRYLKKLWNGFGTQLNENIRDFGFDCTSTKIGRTCTLIIIQLPQPQFQPEAYYIGIAYFFKVGIFNNQVNKVRYFTLELGREVNDNREKHYVCEWQHGKSPKKFDHKNYGSINEKNVDSFRLAIKNILFGKSTPSLWVENIPETTREKEYQRDVNINSLPRFTENDLEILWNKWTNFEVDDVAKELCNNAVEPVASILIKYSQLCLSMGIFPEKMANKLMEWIGSALGHLSRGSFMIGLEYPNNYLESPTIKSEVPYQMLEVASTYSIKLVTLFLAKLVENGNLSEAECEKIAEEAGSIILKAMIECYVVGVNNSPKKTGFYSF